MRRVGTRALEWHSRLKEAVLEFLVDELACLFSPYTLHTETSGDHHGLHERLEPAKRIALEHQRVNLRNLVYSPEILMTYW